MRDDGSFRGTCRMMDWPGWQNNGSNDNDDDDVDDGGPFVRICRA